MKTKCLINGRVYKYDAAFPLNSTTEVSRQLEYIGIGVIVEVGGIPYRGNTRLKFYKTIKHYYRGSLSMFIVAFFMWSEVMAGFSFVLPVLTTHVEYDDVEPNNNNPGLGLEYTHDNKYLFGTLYLKKDSFYNENLYIYYGRKFNFNPNMSVSAIATIATNYNNSYVIPLTTFSYYNVRVVTSYPFGKVAGSLTDVINVQYSIPF